MAIYYRINTGPDGSVLTVMGDVNNTISSDSKTYDEAVKYLTTTPTTDLDPNEVLRLTNPRSAVEVYIRRVSERVLFKGSQLLFDGDPIDGRLSEHIIRLASEDQSGDPAKLVKFLENLMNNPSEHSRDQLYSWLTDRDFTITNDGHFLAYKGLNEDYSSIHSGPGIVNSVEVEHGHLDNSPGNIVEIARSYVDTSSFVGCSTGLHAGTYEYAEMFAQGALVLVKINPRDVVSVPTDCEAQKLRVARYEVIEDVTVKIEDVVYGDDDSDDGDYDPYYEDEDLFDDFYDEDYEDDSLDEDEDEDEDDAPVRPTSSLREWLQNN